MRKLQNDYEHTPIMRTRIFQVDAFAAKKFTGNPAAVMPLEQFPDVTVMQAIAQENNLSETAFIVAEGADYRIRWFTPINEVPLCGHATLASAAVVMERLEPDRDTVVFHSASGPLMVKRASRGYVMDFPARHTSPVPMPRGLAAAVGVPVVEVVADAVNYLARLQDASAVRGMCPDFAGIAALDRKGVIVTAQGDGGYDFTSRYFTPRQGVPEDPVTGSAHCALAPYWAKILRKSDFRAFQASRRGGEVLCRCSGDRVELAGMCMFYLEGEAES
jgi:PhzF family phenazine biosynthesis protein